MAPTSRRSLEDDGAHVLGRRLHIYIGVPVDQGAFGVEHGGVLSDTYSFYSSSTVYSYTDSVSQAKSNPDIASHAP